MNKIRILNPARAGLLLFFCCFCGHAQTIGWTWARSAKGGGEGISVATDKSDNVFITGFYADSIVFGSVKLTSTMAVNAFLAKYDAQGNVVWAKTASGGLLMGSWGINVYADAKGNVYLTGYFGSTISFGSFTLTCSGPNDVFLVKYDAAGNVLWAKRAGGTGDDKGYGVATDAVGNIYLTGSFASASITFGTYTLTNSSIGNYLDVFLAKYDSSGNVIWAKKAGGGSNDAGLAVAADAFANVYVTGNFSSTAAFGSYSLIATGSVDIFLTRYDSSGNVLWAKGAGGSVGDEGYSVAADASGNAYLTGYFSSSSVNFGSYTLTNTGGPDAFLVKYDTAGNVRWAKSTGGPGSQKGYSVATDKTYKIYLTCSFDSLSSSVTFDTVNIVRPAIYRDPVFVAGCDSAGHALFAKALGSGGDDQSSVAVASSGCLYVGGDFEVNPFIVGNDSLPLTGGESIFVAKLCYSAQSLPVSHFSASQKLFCEGGGCINLYDSSSGNPTSWKWLFPGASPNMSNVQNPTSICYNNAGTYPVTLIVTNAVGTDTLTVSPMIIVSSGVTPAVVTVSNDTNFSSHGSTYQWYRDGLPIAGATDSFYVCSQGGTYSLRITDSLGCGALSNGVYNSCLTSISSIRSAVGSDDLVLYPNPASKKFEVRSLRFKVGASLEMFNLMGEVIMRYETISVKSSFDISALSSGIYFIQITNGEKTYRAKIIKE